MMDIEEMAKKLWPNIALYPFQLEMLREWEGNDSVGILPRTAWIGWGGIWPDSVVPNHIVKGESDGEMV